MRVTDKEIMNIIQERGVLRFSTLMLRFHISSVQALQIVEEYKKKGIIDDKCRAASGVKTAWKNPYAGETENTTPEPEEKNIKNKGKKNTATSVAATDLAPAEKNEAAITEAPKKKGKRKVQPKGPENKEVSSSMQSQEKPKAVPAAAQNAAEPVNPARKKRVARKTDATVTASEKEPVQMSFLEMSPKGKKSSEKKTSVSRKRTVRKKKEVDGQMSLF